MLCIPYFMQFLVVSNKIQLMKLQTIKFTLLINLIQFCY